MGFPPQGSPQARLVGECAEPILLLEDGVMFFFLTSNTLFFPTPILQHTDNLPTIGYPAIHSIMTLTPQSCTPGLRVQFYKIALTSGASFNGVSRPPTRLPGLLQIEGMSWSPQVDPLSVLESLTGECFT